MFRVVPDQLRVSDGWVRCGQCNEVFDANANLQSPTQSPAVTVAAAVDDQQSPTPSLVEQPPIVLQESTTAQAVEALEPAVDPFLTVNPHALHLDPNESPVLDAVPIFPGTAVVEMAKAEDELAATDVRTFEEVRPSFVKPVQSPSVWGKRSVQAAVILLCLLLSFLLVLQLALHERDRIAVVAPATRPLLESLCAVAGCAVAPFRQIESVVIDSSSFTKVRVDVYQLSFSLKNMAHTAVATPAMELTLIDMQEKPVIRRVFLPGDFGDGNPEMIPGGELNASLMLALKLSGNTEKISGYRLLSFYP